MRRLIIWTPWASDSLRCGHPMPCRIRRADLAQSKELSWDEPAGAGASDARKHVRSRFLRLSGPRDVSDPAPSRAEFTFALSPSRLARTRWRISAISTWPPTSSRRPAA